MPKRPIGINVLEAAKERMRYTFDNFEKIYLSFSGGKDSTVMMHLACEEARRRDRVIGILFVDLEGQYKLTIDHIKAMREEYKDCTEWFWVCLPIALSNGVSQYQPKWECWNPDKKEIWVRDLPDGCINDQEYFAFFRRGMEFEDFVPQFGDWYSGGDNTACFVGIRSDESLNRYRTVTQVNKKMYNGRKWTTKVHGTKSVYNAYPVYDWRTRDVWVYTGKYQKRMNGLYDLMNKAGLSIHQQRICQPYGYDQRKGLWLFHIIEPETWSKIVARVNGANSGAEFVQYNGNVSGQQKITKPEGHTWKSFCEMLLDSMPKKTAEHYRNKIFVFLKWWETRGYPEDIPDEATAKEEAARKVPSWRRIAKSLLRNDWWCKGLSFSQTKDGFFYDEYFKRLKEKRKKEQADRKKNNLRKAGNWRGFI